ncbi:MAG: hypothetical protein E7773_11165 [Sphingomonas sp.]|uniref:hypothetical protein n=1 Tax=Sphingomonas sp. TaxID=28214 RepID=UPI0011F4571D|nr:hypothetical protein [Sphingomonas sp.]THD35020.1 MAG: hypothetical protein E7773_11165 [Sphingomonas sp.]
MPGRYFAFATSAIHENYGWRDFISAHDSIIDALAAIAAFEPDPDEPGGDFEGNIGDSESLKCVLTFEREWGKTYVEFDEIMDEDAVQVKLTFPDLFEDRDSYPTVARLRRGAAYYIVRETLSGAPPSPTYSPLFGMPKLEGK